MENTKSISARLADELGDDRVQVNAPLAPLTTFKVGGAADYLLTVDDAETVRRAIAVARDAGLPVTLLGGGSNVLVSDHGVRGLVVRLRGGAIRMIGAGRIRADAGVTINGLVRWTITHGLAGLEAWAGTPGTVGGAIFGNAHFQGRNISDLVEIVTVVTADGQVEDVPPAAMEFSYDFSRLHRTREAVLSADFRVAPGRPDLLRAVARDSLAYRKRTQPLASPSAGCIFQNPDPSRDRVPEGIPWSAGALVDRAGLKGAREGQARVSATHGNFIINDGSATAADVRKLIDRCKCEVRRQFGVELREEIVYLGSDPSA
ncbi:MAG: UDP-N-acetylmuramate dehydrogenase [Vicinamibacterales bacterium]